MPRPEYDKNPKIYAEVEQAYKEMLEDIRAHLGFKYERDALKQVIADYHKRNKVPPSPLRKR